MEKVLLALGALALLGATLYMTQQGQQVTIQNSVGAIEPQVVDLYGDWKKKYNKKYATPDQDWYRLTVFNDNYYYIKTFYESGDQSYTLDFNQFMDLTPEEFAETYLTLKVDGNRQLNDVFEGVPSNGAVDWVERGKVPAVKNQASCGSCWAFSAVGALETAARVNGRQVNLSEQDLVDCSRSYGNYGCNGGLMDYAFQYVQEHGVADGSAYPYTARDQTCRQVTRSFTISGFSDVKGGDCGSLQAALGNQPVSVAVDASTWQFYAGGVLNNCQKRLNHGVLLVGVSDDGTWKIRNSWGPNWGEQGYIRLQSGDTCGVCEVASFPRL